MPQDNRSKKLVVVAHCILNQNSRVQGLAKFKGTIKPVVETLIKNEVGILQMPCPELLFAGYKRWAQTKEQYDTPAYRKLCRKIAINLTDQIQEYTKNKVKTLAIIGVEGSPTCGITETTKGYRGGKPEKITKQKTKKVKEKGILTEELQKMLQKRKIHVEFIGINEKNLKETIMKIEETIQA